MTELIGMTELIDKNAMLNRFKMVYEKNKEYSVADGLAMAYDMVQGQPTVEAEPKWISVTERLPSESDDYLVTIKFDTETFDTELFYFNAEKTRWLVEERYGENFFVKNKIIAWMELPEPYEVSE